MMKSLNILLTFQHIGKKMKKLTLCALVASTLFAGNIIADEKPSEEKVAEKKSDINPWQHCGIGAMIFSENEVAAVISNVIWDLGTTAVSSQASSQDNCEGKEVKTAQFIQDNYDQVLEETSQGSGEHLTTMLDMLEVNANQQPAVLKSVRSEMANKVAANQSNPEAYYNVVMASL